MKTNLIFSSYDSLWKLDVNHRLLQHGKKTEGHQMKKALQQLIDPHRGHHVPPRMVIERALGGIITFEIVEEPTSSESESDIVFPEQ